MGKKLEDILQPNQLERRKRIQFMLKEIRNWTIPIEKGAIPIESLYEIMEEKFGISYSTFREYLRDLVRAKEVEIVKMVVAIRFWQQNPNY